MLERRIAAQNYIFGEYRDSESARQSLIDPSTEEEVGDAPVSDSREVAQACTLAAEAFEQWHVTPPGVRSRLLLQVADDLEENAHELAQLEALNTGKPLKSVLEEELPAFLDFLRFFAGAARVLDGAASTEYDTGLTSTIRREPIGVCAQITPWNYPLNEAIWKWAPAVASGNTVVLKPASTTPLGTLKMAEIAGRHLPPGVLNIVCGNADTATAMINHPATRMVSLVGSPSTGRAVLRSTAETLTPTHLELGGNAPVLVFGDADVETAAANIAKAAFGNAGQDCTSACRILVQDQVSERFLELLVEQANTLRVGPPTDDRSFCGPLNNQNQLQRVSGFLDGMEGSIVVGGNRRPGPGYYFDLTVVTDPSQDSRIVQDEVFGPVVTVQRFKDEATAYHLANDVDQDLASSVWTSNIDVATRATRALNFGTVWINCHLNAVAEMPHGGIGHSGSGKDLSRYGLEMYTRIKHVMSFVPDSHTSSVPR